MNRFGNELNGLMNRCENELATSGIVGIDTALGLMSCGVDPRDIAEVESLIPHEEDEEEAVDG